MLQDDDDDDFKKHIKSNVEKLAEPEKKEKRLVLAMKSLQKSAKTPCRTS